jgi:hypothetical protein
MVGGEDVVRALESLSAEALHRFMRSCGRLRGDRDDGEYSPVWQALAVAAADIQAARRQECRDLDALWFDAA